MCVCAQAKPTRPVFGGEKPSRSESQGLDDGRPIDLASLLPSNPPGGDASRRAEERVVRRPRLSRLKGVESVDDCHG